MTEEISIFASRGMWPVRISLHVFAQFKNVQSESFAHIDTENVWQLNGTECALYVNDRFSMEMAVFQTRLIAGP